ncbi:MAG: hypothetical protein U5N53_11580 [Mycobacterium sp.]|nr:hypothetical protein [Mycobacterium sp.]
MTSPTEFRYPGESDVLEGEDADRTGVLRAYGGHLRATATPVQLRGTRSLALAERALGEASAGRFALPGEIIDNRAVAGSADDFEFSLDVVIDGLQLRLDRKGRGVAGCP